MSGEPIAPPPAAERVAAAAPGQRFSAHARLHTPAQFARVFAQGQRASAPSLTLHWLWSAEATTPRLGLAVSRKVDRKAVGRNRIKRCLREEFRQLRSHLRAGDYVLVARTAAATATAAQLRAAMRALLARSGALPLMPMTGTMPPLSSSPD